MNDNPWDNPPDVGPTWEQIDRDASRGDDEYKRRSEERQLDEWRD